MAFCQTQRKYIHKEDWHEVRFCGEAKLNKNKSTVVTTNFLPPGSHKKNSPNFKLKIFDIIKKLHINP